MLYYQSEEAGAGVLGSSGSEHVRHTQRKRADGGSGCCSRVPIELAGLSCSLWLEGVPRQHTAPRRQLGSEVKWWKRRNQRERDGPREQGSMRTSKAGRNRPLGEMGRLGDLQRWGSAESYTLKTQEYRKVSRDGEESGRPLEREKKGGGWGEGPPESRREGRWLQTCSGERALGEREARDSPLRSCRAGVCLGWVEACPAVCRLPPGFTGLSKEPPPSFPSPPGPQPTVLAWVMSFQTSWSPGEVTSGRPRPGRQSLLNISLRPWGRHLSGCFSDWFASQLGL